MLQMKKARPQEASSALLAVAVALRGGAGGLPSTGLKEPPCLHVHSANSSLTPHMRNTPYS